MYSSSSKTRCLVVAALVSPAARFLRGLDAVGSNRPPGDAPGVSIAIPGQFGRRVTASRGGTAQALPTVGQWGSCAFRRPARAPR